MERTKKHIVNVEDVKGRKSDWVFARHVGGGEDKTLAISVIINTPPIINYTVTNHGKMVYEGEDIDAAVKCYNLLS